MWKIELVFSSGWAQHIHPRTSADDSLRVALAHAAAAVPPVLLEAPGDAKGPASRTLLLLTAKLTPVLPLSQWERRKDLLWWHETRSGWYPGSDCSVKHRILGECDSAELFFVFPGSLSLATTYPQFYRYMDESLSPENLLSSSLCSELHFGSPPPPYISHPLWFSMHASLLNCPKVEEEMEKAQLLITDMNAMSCWFFFFICVSKVKILYGGTELCDDEVRQTFHIDMKQAVISGASVAALVHVFTSVSGKVWPNCYYSTVHLSFFLPFGKI